VATLHPVALLAAEIGAQRVRVATLVPAGASPHVFEPRPRDVARLAEARAVLRVGGGLDDWTLPLLGAAPRPPRVLGLIDSPGLDPLPADGEAHAHAGEQQLDPHVWLDPLRVRDAIAPAIATELARLDPAGEPLFRARLAAFQERLGALDAELRATLAAAPCRGYVAFHGAWRYFGARYGLEEIAVIEESAGEEPTPRALARLLDAARAAGVTAILIEPQLPPRLATALAAELGGATATVTVDPIGDPGDPARDGYEDLMRWNAAAFARALGAER
jgi:ABC-type Zn uptake system ZnuABC Zn-binding protein ZnuA